MDKDTILVRRHQQCIMVDDKWADELMFVGSCSCCAECAVGHFYTSGIQRVYISVRQCTAFLQYHRRYRLPD